MGDRHNERVSLLMLQLQEKDILLTNAVRVVQDYRHEYDDMARRLLRTALDLRDRLNGSERVATVFQQGSELKLTPLYLPLTGKPVLIKAPLQASCLQQAAPALTLQPTTHHPSPCTRRRSRPESHGRPSTCPQPATPSPFTQPPAMSSEPLASHRAVRQHLHDALFSNRNHQATSNSVSISGKLFTIVLRMH